MSSSPNCSLSPALFLVPFEFLPKKRKLERDSLMALSRYVFDVCVCSNTIHPFLLSISTSQPTNTANLTSFPHPTSLLFQPYSPNPHFHLLSFHSHICLTFLSFSSTILLLFIDVTHF
ncbi:hypothetical protein U1Q18_052594 [Sarracenia purpurea var. burkii]